MRVVLAGCFVTIVVFVAVGVLGAFEIFDNAPPVVVGGGLSLLMLGLCAFALKWFNAKGVYAVGLSPEEHLRKLESDGLLEVATFESTRAFGVEEFEDEGLHYYLELRDGRVLFLSGQYLYDFEPITDDPEWNQPRRFPCAEFAVLRHKTEGYVVDIRCTGPVLEPEGVAPPFGKAVWRSGGVPEDGSIITDTSYDSLKDKLLHAEQS